MSHVTNLVYSKALVSRCLNSSSIPANLFHFIVIFHRGERLELASQGFLLLLDSNFLEKGYLYVSNTRQELCGEPQGSGILVGSNGQAFPPGKLSFK